MQNVDDTFLLPEELDTERNIHEIIKWMNNLQKIEKKSGRIELQRNLSKPDNADMRPMF